MSYRHSEADLAKMVGKSTPTVINRIARPVAVLERPKQAVRLEKERKRAEREKHQAMFAMQLRAAGFTNFKREVLFHAKRDWRLDFADQQIGLAIEIDGGVYTQGRHTRGDGYTEDCIKLAEATILGWTVLRFTTGQVESGVALQLTERWIAMPHHLHPVLPKRGRKS